MRKKTLNPAARLTPWSAMGLCTNIYINKSNCGKKVQSKATLEVWPPTQNNMFMTEILKKAQDPEVIRGTEFYSRNLISIHAACGFPPCL